ncbi:MAG: glycoside hydrolase family protein [Burkholderiales bacterium]|nr:glycoside hydrolase family protein [Burkholderiales bacterium]
MNEHAVRLWNALNGSGNLRAFLRVIRAGESSQGDDAYRMMFGGGLVGGLADHPRRAITRQLGAQTLTSTAAGAYQFLARTWDECARALALPDFSERSQDIAAVYLIERRRALDDVLAGRLDAAVAKCAREWASLPGSPYGQPVKTMEQVREVYRSFGGVERPDGTAAPVESRDVSSAPLPQPKEADVSPFVTAALPSLVELLPKLGRIFSSGSKTAERNVAAAEVVAETVIAATGARNIQEAVEAVRADPALRQAAEQAIDARWYELTEAGGGGIEGARKADAAARAAGDMLHSPSFWVALLLIPLVYMVLVSVLFGIGPEWPADVRAAIATAIVSMVVGAVSGYYFGQTTSRNRGPAP